MDENNIADCDLSIGDLWLDPHQGRDGVGRAFGYIGTNETYEDEDGDNAEFCGWFFTWPCRDASVTTTEAKEAVVDSLELDEMSNHRRPIPRNLAVAELTAYLDERFPFTQP